MDFELCAVKGFVYSLYLLVSHIVVRMSVIYVV